MKLSARSRYAARILLELACQANGSPISASVLSEKTGVSIQFVEQILKPLKQQGFTTSLRGSLGGHKLARSPSEITLGQVIKLMEGGVNLTVCCGDDSADCKIQEDCLTQQAWGSVSRVLENELEAVSLADLLQDGDVCPGDVFKEGVTHTVKK